MRVEPGWDSFGTRQAAVSVARALAAARPDLITDKWWKEERGDPGVHRLQPERPAQDGVRSVVRARPPGAQVSTPFPWDELPAIHPDDLTVQSVPGPARRRAAIRGPTSTTQAQSIAPLVERYERDLASGIPDAPWPPVYPKMPDEARRVNPSRARPDPIA